MRQFRNILTGIALLAPLSAAWGESVTADMTADVVTGRQLDVTGKADVHITSSSPLVNSTVNLNGEYAWLFLDAVKPTRTVSDYLRFITIDGQPADISTNVRIAEYVTRMKRGCMPGLMCLLKLFFMRTSGVSSR